MLENIRYKFKGENGSLTVIKGSLFVIKEERKNGIYVLKGVSVTDSVSMHAKVTSNKTRLWHLRFGHISDELNRHGVLGDDKIKQLEFCEQFILSKVIGVKFNITKHRIKGT